MIVRPGGPTTVTAEDCARFRDHKVRVAGHSRYAFDRFKMRVQLPEIVVASWVVRRPPGRELQAFPELSQYGADLSTQGNIVFVGDPDACNSYHLDIDGVRPGDVFEVILRSVRTAMMDKIVAAKAPDLTITYAEGTAEFMRNGEPVEIGFCVPFSHARERRMLRSLAMRSDIQPMRRQRVRVWGDADL